MDPWQLLRYVLIAGGTLAATESANVITNSDVEVIAGAVVALAAALWGIYTRWKTAAVPVVRAALPDVPVQSSATGVVKTGPGV
jgi:hypothetical protein